MALSAIMGTAPEQAPNIGALIGQGFSQGFLPRFEKGLEQAQRKAQLLALAKTLQPLVGNDQNALALAQLMQQSPEMAREFVKLLNTQAQGGNLAKALTQFNQPTIAPGSQQPNVLDEPDQMPSAAMQDREGVAGILNQPTQGVLGALSPQMVKDIATFEQAERKIKAQERAAQDKKQLKEHEIGSKDYTPISQAGQRATKLTNALNQLEMINQVGLESPLAVQGIRQLGELFGQDWTSLLSAPAQLYETMLVNFYDGFKEIAGGRISEAMLKEFKTKLPGLAKSPEAREQAIKFMKNFIQDDVERLKLADQIIANNNMYAPANLLSRVNKLMGSSQEARAEQANKELAQFLDQYKVSSKGSVVKQAPLGKVSVDNATGNAFVRTSSGEKILATPQKGEFTYQGVRRVWNPTKKTWERA